MPVNHHSNDKNHTHVKPAKMKCGCRRPKIGHLQPIKNTLEPKFNAPTLRQPNRQPSF